MKFSTSSRKFKHKKQRIENITREIDGIMNYLYDEDLKRIFGFLSPSDLINIYNVNQKFRSFLVDINWKSFFEKENVNIKINNTYSLPSESYSYFEKYFIRVKCLERCKESLYDYFLNNFDIPIEWKSEEEKLQFHKQVLNYTREIEKHKIFEFWSENHLTFTLDIFGFYCEIIVPKSKPVIINFNQEMTGDDQSLTFISEINRLKIK